ncbi:MAG: IS30 family transposase [Patescibacteria group bacterium]
MAYHHFSVSEREKIQELLWDKRSVRAIAAVLGRSPSSVSREINRNIPPQLRRYTPRLAQEQAEENRTRRGRMERLKNESVRSHVVSHLKLGWSPEQIAATCKKGVGTAISHEAIYQYVYAQIHRGGYGSLKQGREDLRPFLPRRRKRRVKKGLRSSYRVDKGPLPSIDMRPKEADQRKRIGHWEDDLVVSRASRDALKTINERVAGIVFIARVRDGTMAETNRAVTARLGAVPSRWRKTLTRDRGSENLGYEALAQTLGIRCFFAHPYHSWKRGSNENANGLIRRFFPKGTDFQTITDEEIQRVEYLLNTRPRKRLGWKTPYEVFYERTGVALGG